MTGARGGFEDSDVVIRLDSVGCKDGLGNYASFGAQFAGVWSFDVHEMASFGPGNYDIILELIVSLLSAARRL